MGFDLEIAEHQAALAALRQQRAEEMKAAFIKQLADTRRKLSAVRSEYDKLAPAILQADSDRLNCHKKILDLLEKIGEHSNARPPCADFLPLDPEVQTWQAHHDVLVAERERATASMPKEPDRVRASLLQNDIASLTHLERTIIEKLRGGLGAFPGGGVYGTG